MELNLTVEAIARNYRIDPAAVYDLIRENHIPEVDGRLREQDGLCVMNLLDSSADTLNELRARQYLRWVAGRSAILLDTCVLMHPSFPQLWERLHPLLAAQKRSVIIPGSVAEELNNNFIRYPDQREIIRGAIALLQAGEKDGTVQTLGGGEYFGDREIIYLANRLRADSDVLVVTNDKGLSEDLLSQNNLRSMSGYGVYVNRLSFYGYFAKYRPQQSAC